jgi:uncharacterized protein (DUF983 family)
MRSGSIRCRGCFRPSQHPVCSVCREKDEWAKADRWGTSLVVLVAGLFALALALGVCVGHYAARVGR